MKIINSETNINEYPEPNLEPPYEDEDELRCDICHIAYQVENYQGRNLCPDCAYDMYAGNDIYR